MLKEQLPPETEDFQPQSGDSKLGDRILIWCFLASILINLGFGLWLNYADIYGEKRQADANKVMKVAVYRPPIKKKPPPPKKIIPPKPKIIPKIVHKLPPPRPTPPKAPPQHFTVGHHSTSKTAIVVEAPPPPVDNTPVQPVAPENTTVQQAPPVQTPPAPTPSVKYEPPVQAPPVKQAPPYHPPPPLPPPPHHPPNYIGDVDARQASIIESSIQNPDTSAMDATTITGPCIISYEVGETGRISNVRIKKSSGNHEYDSACQQVIQGAKGTPAVQDHIPVGGATGTYSFSAS